MAGYFEEYGVAEARRGKVISRIVISAVVLAVIGLVVYFISRTWAAKRDVGAFLTLLERKEYEAAYHAWGCAKPCRDYSFERFMTDWGPKSEYANAGAASIKRARVCSNKDVIVTLSSPSGGETPLMYDHTNGSLGFSPWPICDPRIPEPALPPH